MVRFQVPAPLVLLPQLERARREVRVDPAGAVGPADHPGLTARAGARVAGPPGVHQRDAGAAPQQVERGPAAEGPCADHHHVPLLAHRTPALQKERRAERRARGGAGLEERPPRDAPHVGVTRGVRASRTAARTASRSDRKSTRLNSSHSQISYAVFCLKKKNKDKQIEYSVNQSFTSLD